MTIARGETVPHFTVRRLDGTPARYSTIWQRDQLVLVILPGAENELDAYVTRLMEKLPEFTAAGAALVITREPVANLDGPSALVADRWGEVQHLARARSIAELPPVDELLDWVRYVQQRCPECEGEAR